MKIDTRSLNQTDLVWLEPLYKGLMKPYYDTLGIEWIVENFYKGIDYSLSRVVQFDGVDIGYLKTELRPDCLYIGDIVLKDEYQKRGIGGILIKREEARARQLGLAMKPRVLKGNRAIENEYELVKRGLAKDCWVGMNDYADAKSTIVERILASASEKGDFKS